MTRPEATEEDRLAPLVRPGGYGAVEESAWKATGLEERSLAAKVLLCVFVSAAFFVLALMTFGSDLHLGKHGLFEPTSTTDAGSGGAGERVEHAFSMRGAGAKDAPVHDERTRAEAPLALLTAGEPNDDRSPHATGQGDPPSLLQHSLTLSSSDSDWQCKKCDYVVTGGDAMVRAACAWARMAYPLNMQIENGLCGPRGFGVFGLLSTAFAVSGAGLQKNLHGQVTLTTILRHKASCT
eukprot:g4036.t1